MKSDPLSPPSATTRPRARWTSSRRSPLCRKASKGNNSTAEIAVNKAGTVVYGSNRGHDSIAVFNVDPAEVYSDPVGQVPTLGKTPRNFALDPTGAWLLAANQDSSDIAIFKVNGPTGQLVPSANW